MLSFRDPIAAPRFLRVGSLALGGLSLPGSVRRGGASPGRRR